MVAFAELTVLVCLPVVPGRRRAGCHGSLRELWSSWYASLSAPLSTPWLRAALSAGSRRDTQRRRQSEDRSEVGSGAAANPLLPADALPLYSISCFHLSLLITANMFRLKWNFHLLTVVIFAFGSDV